MNPGIKSRVPNRFDFDDYAPQDVAEIGYLELLRDDYVVDGELYRRVVAAKYARSADKSNGRWVRNFNQELIRQMAQRVVASPVGSSDDLAWIADEDVYRVVGRAPERGEEELEETLGQLDALVGLAPVKDWVRKLVTRAGVDQQRLELDGSLSRPTYHMVFAGSPGTGKTTVARIVARLFHHLGILETPTVKMVDRAGLVGRHIGETEVNTTRVIDEAMGESCSSTRRINCTWTTSHGISGDWRSRPS